MTLRCYRVTTTLGAVFVMAFSLSQAICTGLELCGPGATLLSCLQEGDW